MKIILLRNVLFIMLFTSAVMMKAQNFSWAVSAGGANAEAGLSVAVDQNGNVYSTGYFSDTVDFDNGAGVYNLISAGSADAYVQKLDPQGNLVWAFSVGGTAADYGYSIACDANGDVYFSGTFQSTADLQPGSGQSNFTATGMDIFLIKLDGAGNFQWARKTGGSGSDVVKAIQCDQAGNIYTIGYFSGTADFDPGAGTYSLNVTGGRDVFVQKLTPAGNFVWAVSMGGMGNDDGIALHITEPYLYLTGDYNQSVDFDPGSGTANLNSNGAYDIFIEKLDTAGNFLWVKGIGNVETDVTTGITSDQNGNCFITGYFHSTVDFDPGAGTFNLTGNGATDVFLLKLNASGNFVWAKSFGNSGYDLVSSVCLDAQENVIVTGYFSGTVDFDPGAGMLELTSNGSYDVFLQKLDSSANLLWAKSYGGLLDDAAFQVTADDFGSLYLAGQFADTADFDPGTAAYNLISNGSSDIFVQKFKCFTSAVDVQFACGSFTWIDGNTYTSSNNTASYTMPALIGCDSIITLDLTITNIDTTVSFTGNTLYSNTSDAAYQWIDCNGTPISGATAQSFVVVSNGNYAVVITKNGCSDTSSCTTVTNAGVSESNQVNIISAYPNPVKEQLTIDAGRVYANLSITVKDVLGREIFEKQFYNTSRVEFIPEGKQGFYFVTLRAENKIQAVIKIWKED